MKTQFELYETNNAGERKGAVRRLGLNELPAALALRCPRLLVKQLRHYIDLAMANVGTEVDVTHWERGALVFSARLRCVEHDPQRRIILPS